MQTFLPFADFAKSARSLDMKRLGKQRVETMQLLSALTDPSYGWQNHTATRMWRGHSVYLLRYQYAICKEWTQRGYKDTCWEKSARIIGGANSMNIFSEDSRPPWLGDMRVHISHRSNLLRKQPEHYAEWFSPDLSDAIPYYWPKGSHAA